MLEVGREWGRHGGRSERGEKEERSHLDAMPDSCFSSYEQCRMFSCQVSQKDKSACFVVLVSVFAFFIVFLFQ